jgi:hypothetical protein
MPGTRITIGGSTYVEVEGITLARQAWIVKWARQAGLMALADIPEPDGAEAARRRLEQVIEDAFAADAVVPLLAGCLTPEGVPWSEPSARETMIVLADAREAEQLLEAFGGLVMGFLRRAPAFWSHIGRSSSTVDESEPAGARAKPQPSQIPTPEDSTTSPGRSPSSTLPG